jgi:hypothetical protein
VSSPIHHLSKDRQPGCRVWRHRRARAALRRRALRSEVVTALLRKARSTSTRHDRPRASVRRGSRMLNTIPMRWRRPRRGSGPSGARSPSGPRIGESSPPIRRGEQPVRLAKQKYSIFTQPRGIGQTTCRYRSARSAEGHRPETINCNHFEMLVTRCASTVAAKPRALVCERPLVLRTKPVYTKRTRTERYGICLTA